MDRVCVWTPLLETLGAGAIDYGYTGDAPPIFAQAARAKLLYAAAIPARGYGQAIVVPAASSIQDVSGLAGKKVAVAKASSAHNLLRVARSRGAGGRRGDRSHTRTLERPLATRLLGYRH